MSFSKILYLFLLIFLVAPKKSWTQDFMYFIKGADMKTVSFLEPGSSLGFSNEDVIINGEKLVKRGSVRFTSQKYVVYPSTINSSNGGMDIDVYLGSDNCIIDWGNNTLEQFKLIEVDLASYKKSESKQNEIKKSKYLIDLSIKVENLEKDLTKTEYLNEKLGLIYSILTVYNQDYKNLFQNDPPEIFKLNQLTNEISSKIEKQKNELISYDKKMDSLRIFNVRVISFSNSDKSIDTFMVLKRATSLVFYTFFKDSSNVLNNYLDSNFISEFSKKVNVIKILNSTYLDDTTDMQLCELNIPLIDFFNLGKNSGWKLPIPNLSNGTIFKVRKLDFLKNQEFNAMCDIIGSLHNLTVQSLESKVKKSALINESNMWKAKYEIDIIFNEKINNIRKSLLNNFTYFSLSNLDLNDTYKSDDNIEKFSIFINPEIGEKSDIVSTNRGNYIQYVFVNNLTFNLIKDYFKKLNDFYFEQWSVNVLNKNYYGTQKDMIPSWNLRNNSSDEPQNWVYYHSPLSAEYNAKSIYIKFPQKSQIITSYTVNLDLKESEIEKYTDTLKFVFQNRFKYRYKEGGFSATLYTYGILINKQWSQEGNKYQYFSPSPKFMPTQLLPIIKENWAMNISYGGKYYLGTDLGFVNDSHQAPPKEICNIYFDTLTRGFWSPVGGGKKGKKEIIVYAKPTKVKVLNSYFPLYTSNDFDNYKIMISYLTGWNSNYTAENIYINSVDMLLKENYFFNNYSKWTNATSSNEVPHTGFKILKIEKQ